MKWGDYVPGAPSARRTESKLPRFRQWREPQSAGEKNGWHFFTRPELGSIRFRSLMIVLLYVTVFLAWILMLWGLKKFLLG